MFNVTETSERVSPGGSVIDLGSVDSFAKVKLDSTHPVIAQEQIHNGTISRHLSTRLMNSTMTLFVALFFVTIMRAILIPSYLSMPSSVTLRELTRTSESYPGGFWSIRTQSPP